MQNRLNKFLEYLNYLKYLFFYDIVEHYVDADSDSKELGKEKTKEFLLKNKNVIIKIGGKNLFQELLLNYIIKYDNRKFKKKLCFDKFLKIINNKKVEHTSDIALAYNLLSNLNLNSDQEKFIIKFICERMKLKVQKKEILLYLIKNKLKLKNFD
jgi:hypothetical protein